MIEDTSRFVLDLDVVAHVLPVENSLLSLDSGSFTRIRFVRLLRGTDARAGLDIFGLARSLAATEEENLTLRFGLRDVLGGSKVGNHEKHHERDHDTQIPPLVAAEVLETLGKIRGSVDRGSTGSRSNRRANLVGRIRVSISERDEAVQSAREGPAVEFVDHQTFETVTDRVDVVHPSGPAKHVSRGNGEPGVDDQTKNKNGGGHQRLGETARRRSDRTEQHRHGHGSEEGEEQEHEERARLDRKSVV